ncbi:hypothetical protein SSX86_031056 [Deinandra increscens subsp. villosa]|uniref:SWIM-type domain-containing protein n=1 Tax=Deinandra increscens subsp. villosa TaxID=3103831 RepID=A0AAP0C5J1_9ASTR
MDMSIDNHTLIEDSAPVDDVSVDASCDFGIEHIDSNNMLVGITGSSTSSNVASSSSSSTSESQSAPPMVFIGVEEHDGARSSVFATSDGTKYWKPDVDPSYIPVLGSVYDSWEHVTNMYDAYAAKAGFSTRLGTHRKINDVTRHRYILCNRAGKPKLQNFNSMNPDPVSASKTSRSSLTDCGACIRSKFDPDTQKYTLYTFVEAHNHELIGPEFMDFSSKRRMLDFSTQQFIHQLSLNKIGASVAHNVQCSLKGGHHNVRGTKTEFKNFARAIRIFIGDRDAKLVLDTLEERTKNLHNFFYESLIVGNELKSLFWADDVSRCNYEVFGEVLAFDATYKTNQYCMIFVPFTGVDHHKKCVTFGAGLISDETIESYTWLLQCFLKAHVTQPRLVLTDQDGSMKSAIEAVFYQSAHRLCMWHIMRKLPSKIEDDAVDNAALRKSIHKLVWNLIIKPCDFEEKWQLLMAEYGLANHDWLTTMYNMRGDWIPAYFRDLPMCCLMKTTSICESSNAFFKVNSSGGNTLLQFLMCFDTAIDAQRNNQRKLEFDTNTTVPEIHTRLPIERHAASLYTITIFKEVQKEIERSLYQCSGGLTRTVGTTKIYTIAHANRKFVTVNEFEVSIDLAAKTVSCSCLCFTRIGFLCRHIFYVFRCNQVNKIPQKYMSARWARNALPSRVYDIANRYSVDTSESGVLRNEIMGIVPQCTDRLRRQPDQLAEFLSKLKELKKHIFSEVAYDPSQERTSAVISDILRQPEFGTSSFVPTQGIRNKGCGTDKRLIGPGEKAIEAFKKGPRLCKKCNKYVYDHDSRNCDKVRRATEIAAAAAAAAAAASAVASADPFDTHVHQAVDSANQPCVDDGAPVVPPNAPPVRRQPTRAAKRSSGRAAGSPAT